MFIVLHNVRSAHNVGSVLRTADGAGVKKVFLTGYTPAPIDRFGRVRKDIAKVALGAEESVLWELCESVEDVVCMLQEEGARVVAVEQDGKAKPYKEVVLPEHTAFVFGNEVEGVPKDVVKLCDEVIEIPMHGAKESLNVSVAVGIISFAFKKN